uniref:Uncharacterized protein n=1 Tax=Haemonchus placei TaxID=6290 RepID=A0A158QMP5_HAEPC
LKRTKKLKSLLVRSIITWLTSWEINLAFCRNPYHSKEFGAPDNSFFPRSALLQRFDRQYLIGGKFLIQVIGVATERRGLVNAHVTITTSLMVFTDMIAIGIVFIMAIGNRNDFTNSLPSHFVNEKKFYDAMGPFWMYLGAFSLHITVAFNMCCLQPYTVLQNSKSKSTAIGKVEERTEKAAELEETKKKSKDQ